MPDYTMESGGKSYTFSSDSPLSDSELQAAAAQYFGPEQSTIGKIGSIVGEELAKTPGRMVEGAKSRASDLWESFKNPKLGTILPLTLGGPYGTTAVEAGAAVPTVASGILGAIRQGAPGAIASATATGVGRAVDAPEGQKLQEGLKAGGLALAWNAALLGLPYAKIPYLSKSQSLSDRAGALAGRQAEFERVGKAPMEAYEAMKDSVPPGAWMRVPSLSPTPITFEEASKGLSRLQGVDWMAARNEIFRELEHGGPSALFSGPALNPPVKASVALGGQAPQAPYTAQGFNIRVPEARFTPPSSEAERFATRAIQGLHSPITRAAADTIAPEQGPGGYTVGAWPGILAGSALKHYAPRWLGGGR